MHHHYATLSSKKPSKKAQNYTQKLRVVSYLISSWLFITVEAYSYFNTSPYGRTLAGTAEYKVASERKTKEAMRWAVIDIQKIVYSHIKLEVWRRVDG